MKLKKLKKIIKDLPDETIVFVGGMDGKDYNSAELKNVCLIESGLILEWEA